MKTIAFSLMFFLSLLTNLHAAEVKNSDVRQVGNRILFEFDVAGDQGEDAEVNLTLTIKGKNYSADQLHLEGDYGKTKASKGKKIYWNVLQDFPRGLSGKVEWDIVTNDTNRIILQESDLKNQKDKVSYSIGIDIGNNLNKQSILVDPRSLTKGIKDVYTGGKTLMTEQEVHDTLVSFQKEMAAKQQARSKTLGEKNEKEGEAFLAENKKKWGIVTLPSGLQYKVITEGAGKTPKATDTVTVNYKGTLIDGTEFDSSYRRGQPVSFPVNGVIAGWTEALQLMKEGSKWQLFIPSNLAYGEKGAGNTIGPNATLIFEVDLESVK